MIRAFDGIRVQRRAVALLVAGAVLLGVAAAVRLPNSILPDVTFPRISIVVENGELPADVMMWRVTRPLEESLRRVPGIMEIRSTTSRGSASINLDCAWGSDMNLSLQRVQGRIEEARARLGGASVEARLMNPTLFPVLGFSLTSDRSSLAALRDFAVLTLQPELSRLPGVAEVVVQGGRRLEARVTLDPPSLQARGLDGAGVADAIRRRSTLEPAGRLESGSRLYLGLVDGRPADLGALESILIPVAAGPPIPLRELGRVAVAEAPEFVRYRAPGGEAVLVSLLRQSGASAITLSRATRAWMDANRKRLPPGTRVNYFYDQAGLVRASAASVRDSLLVGAILAAVVVLLFLRDVRLGIGGAIALPGSVALTLVALQLAHQSLNMMTLGGIAAAVGLVLDDAVVVVEHLSHRTQKPGGVSRSQAMSEILPSLVGSSLCTLAIFAPFLFLGGVAGAFFRVLSLSMVLMLTSSMVLCTVAVPLLCPEAGEPRPRDGGAGWAVRLVRFAVDHSAVGVAGVLLLAGLSVPLQRTLGTGFLPEMDEGALILDYATPPGSSLQETDRMLREIEGEIAQIAEIESWSRRTGDQLGFFITEPNVGDYVLKLRERRSRSADEIADDLRHRIERTQPAVTFEFGQLVEDVIGDLTTTPQPIEVRIFDEDRSRGEAKAREVAEHLQRIRGVVDVRTSAVVSGPTTTIVPAPLAARAALGAEDLAKAVAPAVAGMEAGSIMRGPREWPVRVVVPRRPGLTAGAELAEVLVPVGPNQQTRLGDLATLRTDPGETELNRDNLRTVATVTARLVGRDLGSAVGEIRQVLARDVVFPPGASVQYGGLWAEQQSSFLGLAGVLAGATALVLLILLVAFQSWGLTFAVLAVIASSVAGVFGALHVAGATFNISSFVGTIMMVGIVAENAYFVVAAFRREREAGRSPKEAALAAALRRARPVLMTILAGVAALTPLALGWGEGSALLQPLAVAVVGGFITSALSLLIVLPSLLAWAGGPHD